jgi:hypothetical protein
MALMVFLKKRSAETLGANASRVRS